MDVKLKKKIGVKEQMLLTPYLKKTALITA